MANNSNDCVVVGDEIGLIKVVPLVDSSSNKKYSSVGNCTRKYGVVGLEKLYDNKIASLHVDGTLKLWNFDTLSSTLDELSSVNINGDEDTNQVESFLGMNRVKEVDTSAVVCYAQSGLIKIYVRGTDQDDIDGSMTEMTSFQVTSPVSACSTLSGGIILGGKENDLKIYDYATQSVVWEAENVPNDYLDLRVPIYITSVDLLNPTTDCVSTGAHVTTGTGYKQVRLYDTQASKAPVHSFDIGDYRVTALRSIHGHQVYVADTAGGLSLWDLRTYRKVQTLKGCVGSIRDIQLSEDQTALLCVGLDRYLHVYGTERNKLSEKIYVKSRLNCCLALAGSSSNHKKRRNTNKHNDDDDCDDDFDEDGNYEDDGDALVEYDDDEEDEEDEEDDEEEDAFGQGEDEKEEVNSSRRPAARSRPNQRSGKQAGHSKKTKR